MYSDTSQDPRRSICFATKPYILFRSFYHYLQVTCHITYGTMEIPLNTVFPCNTSRLRG